MNIEIQGRINVKLNDDKTSTVVKSPNATGNLLIPRFVLQGKTKYIIKSLSSDSFEDCQIESLTFPDDSEVTSFGSWCFCRATIKKLQIPSKLQELSSNWCLNAKEITEIEVSPKNENFSILNNQFFVGKSCNQTFDTIYYAKYDIEEAIIPSQIKYLSEGSFINHKKLKSIIFKSDSKIEKIYSRAFSCSSITKLVLPSSISYIDSYNFEDVPNLCEISISPDNTNFKFLDNQFLVGKNDNNSKIFDKIYFARNDIEEAIIPSQIKYLGECSFQNHKKLKSIIFKSDSKIEKIKYRTISCSSITKLVLPSSISDIDSYNFEDVPNLCEISISPNNKNFLLFEQKLLFKKGDNGKFDILIFCCRNVKHITIPEYTKKIKMYSFGNLKYIKNLIFPKSLEYVDQCSFLNSENLETIEFLSNKICITSWAFKNCQNLTVVTFPNATEINIKYSDSLEYCPETTIFKVRKNVNLVGEGTYKFKWQIQYIEEIAQTDNKKEIKKPSNNKKSSDSNMETDRDKHKDADKDTKREKHKDEDEKTDKDKEISILKKRILYLETRLQRYEQIPPIDPTTQEYQASNEYEYECESDQERRNKDNIFIDEQEEEFHEVLSKIGEGSTSVAFKILDKRTGETMCKKILKVDDDDDDENKFQQFRNNLKEFEVLHMIDHPCICKAIGINVQEKVTPDKGTNSKHKSKRKPGSDSDSESEFESESDDDHQKDEREPKTTIAIFMKYEPYSLKKCLETGQLNNTLKVKIAIEIAFGMSHVHSRGMIHRDLKIENVMLDYIYECKIIDFGLVHVEEVSGNKYSLTKGVGTLAYMSPEMASEEDYDNKTDVYSYGVLLHVIFSGRLPKQSLKEKVTNKEPRLSKPSSSISEYCLKMIKRCMSFESKKRPTFDEIIDDFYRNSFKLATEIDFDTIIKRYQTLNRLRVLNQKKLNK